MGLRKWVSRPLKGRIGVENLVVGGDGVPVRGKDVSSLESFTADWTTGSATKKMDTPNHRSITIPDLGRCSRGHRLLNGRLWFIRTECSDSDGENFPCNYVHRQALMVAF